MDRRLALSTLLFAAANIFGDERKEIANTKGTEPQTEGMGLLSSRDSDQWQKQSEMGTAGTHDGISDRPEIADFVRPKSSGAL